jgi:PPP family 3-phenylpropionic acid transporter
MYYPLQYFIPGFCCGNFIKVNQETKRKISMRKFWPFSFYFLYFAAIASHSPYMVLFFQSLEFTGTQIGLIIGITPLITLVSVPLWTGLADRTLQHRLIMSIAMMVGIIGLILLPFLKTFELVFSLGIIMNFFFSPVSAIADNASMFMLAEQKDLIGRLRLGGTIGFGIAAPIVGFFVEGYGLKLAFWGAGGLFFLGFLVSQKLIHRGEVKEKPQIRGRLGEMFGNPLWILFLVSAFTCGFAFAVTNTYFFPYMKELGANESTMGVALTIGTIAEIPILLFVNRFVRRFKPFSLLIFSMIMTGVRLLLFAAATSPGLVLFAQLLNGFGYPLTWVSGVSYANENAPEGLRTTAQGFFSGTSMGLGSAVGGFIGGIILGNIGGRGLCLTYGVVIFVVLTTVWLIRKKLIPRKIPPIGSNP